MLPTIVFGLALFFSALFIHALVMLATTDTEPRSHAIARFLIMSAACMWWSILHYLSH